MEVGDKNVMNAASLDPVFSDLHLGALATVNEKEVFVKGNHLGCRVTVKGRQGGVVSEDSDS